MKTKEQDDLSRQSSPDVVRATRSPRSPQPEGCELSPGPWRIAPNLSADWWGRCTPETLVIDAESMPVCATNDDGVPTIQEVVNARLIAAAPDLLAALKLIAGDRHACGSIRHRALTAIAKAEGQ